jgi:hypothetical protein
MIQVTVPNGGEHWQRGVKYFIQWNDNLSQSVVIRLYKGGALVSTITTVSVDSAYQWECPLDLTVGDDYSIRVESSTNEDVADVSDGAFTIF